MSRRGLWMGMLATAACAVHPKPLPVLGTAPDISALAGDWAGEYRSAETRRTGHITFTLAAGRDTAFGDVIMVPPVEEFPVHEPGFPVIKMRAQRQVLTIRLCVSRATPSQGRSRHTRIRSANAGLRRRFAVGCAGIA